MARSGSEILGLTVNGKNIQKDRLQTGVLSAFSGATASVVLTPGGTSLTTGSQATGYLSDFLFDTGLINPAVSPTAITLTFSPGLVNGPGPDLAVLEIHPSSPADPFQATVNGNTLAVLSSSYGNTGAVTANATVSNTRNVPNTVDVVVSSLGALNAAPLRVSFPNISQAVFGVALDLSDFGVAEGGRISSIQLGSRSGTNFDPVFVAGILPIDPSASFKLPPPSEWTAPAGFPAAPGSVVPQDRFSALSVVPSGAPVISEWHRTVFSGESLVLTGKNLTRSGGSFPTVYLMGDRGGLSQAVVSFADDSRILATLPDGLGKGMFLIWVENDSGISAPVTINRPRPEWLGPLGSKALPGQKKRVFGRNLSRNHANGESHVFLRSVATGEFHSTAVGTVEPYSVEFDVPTNLANGEYEVYVHNGSGGIYGFGGVGEASGSNGPPILTVISEVWQRGNQEILVAPSGGDDTSAFSSALATLTANPQGGTLRLQAGTYTLSAELIVRARVRVIGAGRGQTIIRMQHATVGREIHSSVVLVGNNIAVEDLTIHLAQTEQMPRYYLFRSSTVTATDDLLVRNVGWRSDSGVRIGAVGFFGHRMQITDVDAERNVELRGADNWVHNNNFWGNPFDGMGNAGGVLLESDQSIVERNHFENRTWPTGPDGSRQYKDLLTADQRLDSLWLKRVISASAMRHSYIAHNTSKDVAIHDNYGEMILFHEKGGSWLGKVLSASSDGLVLDEDGSIGGIPRHVLHGDTATLPLGGLLTDRRIGSTDLADLEDYAIIVRGPGFGQARKIVQQNGNTIQLETPWRVQPEPGSLVVIAPLYYENLIYRNELNAFPEGYILDSHSASNGIQYDGNSWRNVAQENVSSRTSSGRRIGGRNRAPSYWNEFRDEVAQDILFAEGVMILTSGSILNPAAFANAVRGGSMDVQNPAASAVLVKTFFPSFEVAGTPDLPIPFNWLNIVEGLTANAPKFGIVESQARQHGLNADDGLINQSFYRRNVITLDGPDAVPLTLSVFSHPVSEQLPPEEPLAFETGTKIYVDSNNGDDASDGSSQASAVKTLLRAQQLMDAVPPEEMVTLMMARGSVWRESYSPKSFTAAFRAELAAFPTLADELAPTSSTSVKRSEPYGFGRDRLNLVAYGFGDKPTINGTDVLVNSKFTRPEPTLYPNVWSQRVSPPVTYFVRAFDKITYRTGVIVDQQTPFWRVYTPLEEPTRDYPNTMVGIQTESDALVMVNSTPNSFYVRNNQDGTFDYFINSGNNPTNDGRLYEYRVRGSFIAPKQDSRWRGIRIYGMNHRDGVSGRPKSIEDVEFVFGDTHNMLIGEGHFKNVTSIGYRPNPPDGFSVTYSTNGDTSSIFHTHAPNSPGIVYDGCIGKNASTAFFDHHAQANRPAVVLRNCVTENVRNVLSHGSSTQVSYIIGHRHSGPNGSAFGHLGGLAANENYIEDSIFRLKERGGWHASTKMLRVRNSVLYMDVGQRPLFLWGSEDIEYDNVTLILDYKGITATVDPTIAQYGGTQPTNPAKVKFKNSVIAVINAPNVSQFPGDKTRITRFGNCPNATFENCVFTYMTGLPQTGGTLNTDYVFATQAEIFSGDPGQGDYTINPEGPAGLRDAGYKPGRTPVYGTAADAAAASFVFYEGAVNQPPVAVALSTPTAGFAPLSVSWNGYGSSDPDGSILSYQWTFSDGGSADGASVTREYAEPGTYSATLTVTDNEGATASHTASITVGAGATTRGTPISWLTSRFGPAADYEVVDTTDHDGDGQPTWLEYRAGTNPQNASDAFRMVNTMINEDGTITLEWRGSSEHGVTTPFRVLGSPDLGATLWQIRAESVPRAPTGNTTWTDPSPPNGTNYFYKIEAP